MDVRKDPSKLWIDYDFIDGFKMPFNIIIGGRAGGKTYGAIKHHDENDKKYVYLRRTQTEADLLISNKLEVSLNPFKAYANDTHIPYVTYKINKNMGGFGIGDPTDAEVNHKFRGYILALTTVASIRGFDASDMDSVVYDEFIAESHRNKIKNEAEAFLNAYETMNRNREFKGKEPLKTYLLSNSNSLASPLLDYLGLVNVIYGMKKKKKVWHVDKERGIFIYLPTQREFQEKKRRTAIAQLTKGTSFYEMAYENSFAYDDFTNIESRDISKYKPVCDYAGIGIWEAKDGKSIYCCLISTKRISYKDNDTGILSFNMDYGRAIYGYYVRDMVYYQNFAIKEKIVETIK